VGYEGRDKNRISPLLAELEYYWKQHPDLRLGQLVYNVCASAGYPDVFYLDDDRFLTALREFFDGEKIV